ncbi:fibronectin type III domain-containing protein [Marinobacter sp.]|uniref:fibronectin type III domain-containing protein n=1 Tax=Marinobacter sp. TaxID=50741 RepID=UPI003562A927
MKRVIKMSQAWIAAFILGSLLTGCGGGGSSESAGTQTGSADSGGQVSSPERSAVLSWSAPLTRVNGESIPMGELDRYVIRYGQDAEELSEEVVVTNAQAEAEMSYEVSGLEAGTWYFTIQVQDTSGLISEPSDVVSKSIRS